jgi:glycosyltransferase involved in cell wall biosynthesis
MLDLGAAWRGGQIQTFLLARELARAGEDVTVAARRGSPLALELERSAADELAVEAVRPGGEGHPGVLLDVARAAARRDPEVLYAGDARGHGAAVWSLAARRRPLVVHRRVAFPPGRDWFSRRKYAAADTLLAISESVARALREAGIPPDRIVVVPDGLAPEAFVEDAAPAAPPYRLVHVGMFDGKKGQEVAIDAVARLAALGWDVHAAFLGDGPGRDALERRASAAGVAERCAFPGIVADVAARLAASHLLLMTSSSEGGSLAVLEAMAAGCPVLAHDVEGAGEFVREAGSGGLVRGLDPESWADAIARTLRDTTATRSWILSGRRYAASRTIAATAALVLEELSKGSGLDS